jgi:hypothetical protein
MRGTLEVLRFNGGLVSKYLLARLDLRKLSVCATTFTNWMLRSLGYMFLRPGLQYIGGIASGTACRMLPFVKAVDDTAVIELSASSMRVRIDDVLITYPATATALVNPNFSAGTGWTDSDEAGGTSTIGGGFAAFASNGTAFAIREQSVAVASGDQALEHCLAVTVTRGPVLIRVGTSSGDDSLVAETALGQGQHRLAFTPNASTVYVRLFSRLQRTINVSFCNFVTGVMQITAPWATQNSMRSVRYDQSGDVIFVASTNDDGTPLVQNRIERRGAGRSWSLVTYGPEDGPFLIENTTPTTMVVNTLNGNGTLTASRPVFRAGHAPAANGLGALFSVTSVGQTVTVQITAENTFTDAIEVTGVGTTRAFTLTRSGTWTATVTLQRSLDSATGPWSDVSGETYTTNGVKNYNDGLDNLIAWYRIGVATGDFTSGMAEVHLVSATGGIRGICRVTSINSNVSANVEILKSMGALTATDVWQEGQWSQVRGYPTAVKFNGLRLWWAGKGKGWGSLSDGFDVFDELLEGDSAPINRTLTAGPTDRVTWIAALRRLIFGCQAAEVSVVTSSLDEPITPTNFDPRATSTQGSGRVDAVQIDQGTFFVNRSGMKMMLLAPDSSGFDYVPTDAFGFAPELGYPGIVSVAVARQPETRIYAVRSDGKCIVLLQNGPEDVKALHLLETDGSIIDVLVMPAADGEIDDRVRFAVTRTVGGVPVTYIERMALETETRGGVTNKTCDSFVYYSGASTTTITGLSHLNGREVVAWGNGARISTGHGDDQVTFTVSGGQITLPSAVTTACVGLPYTADKRTTKLAYLSGSGKSALGARKKVDALGLVLADTDRGSLQFGPDFDTLDPLPEIEFYAEAADFIDELEGEMMMFPRGDWTTDSRVCLRADSPGHAHVLAMVIDMESNSR